MEEIQTEIDRIKAERLALQAKRSSLTRVIEELQHRILELQTQITLVERMKK